MSATAPEGVAPAVRAAVERRLLDGPGVGATPAARRARLAHLLADEAPLLAGAALADAVDDLYAALCGLGPLEPLLADPEVTEVMVHGGRSTFVERRGRIERVPLVVAADELARIAERVVAPLGLRLDRSSPLVDARLPDGSRFHAVIPPVALDGPSVTIRRFGEGPLPLAAFGSDPVTEVVAGLVRSGATVLVAGATGSGKTSLLGSLSRLLGPSERVVTIEETAELVLAGDHVVRLEARPPNAEGRGEVTVRQLVRAALRMRPDRIVVGEVRGGEALDLLQALHTGHRGSLSTVHAHGPDDALRRIETLALQAPGAPAPVAVERLVATGIDAVVHLVRASGGARTIDAVHLVERASVPAATRPLVRHGRVVAVAPSEVRRAS